MRILTKTVSYTPYINRIPMVINELLSLTIRAIVDGKKYEKE